jgi:hypothetical protein
MVETYLKPLKLIYDKKQEIESRIKEIETKGKSSHAFQTVLGVDHKTISQAIVADIIDAIPLIGEVSSVSRIRQSEDSSRRALQGVDLAVDVFPPPFGTIAELLLPANTIWFIEQELKRSK